MRRFIVCAFVLALALGIGSVARGQTITLSGSIDASNIMQVGPSSVTWIKNTGQDTTSLLVNGTSWDPAAQPTLNLPGPLWPSPLSNYFVHTNVSSGRDLANAQIVGNQVLVYVDDTPGGADNYSMQVTFTPRPAPTLSSSATIHVTGNIDGSDILRITNSSATWIHNQWSPPTNVSLNGISWDTVNDPTLANAGATTFLPGGVDLSTVSFLKNIGRDTSTYQLFSDHIDVYFADDQPGASLYDDTLSFGSVPEPGMMGVVVVGGMAVLGRRRGRRIA